MNSEVVSDVYRSRLVLLELLEQQGYNTTPYSKFSPKEILEMIKSGPTNGAPPALMMTLDRKEPQENEPNQLVVVYSLGRIKQKIVKFVEGYVGEDTEFDPMKQELLVVTLEPILPVFHVAAYTFYRQFYNKEKDRGLRVRFWQAKHLIMRPWMSELVPPHVKVPKAEEEPLLKGMFVTKKRQLPMIRFHEDPQARVLGLMPGDIVKITRPSPTAGEDVRWRVCVP
jgi:DNA-directed RNA polymerase subunit H (RpoH/RPB5)